MEEEKYIAKFWDTIEKGRKPGENAAAVSDRLAGELASMDAESVLQWALIFDRYHKLAYQGKLWGAANIMDDGFCSDDGFMDFRAWLIAQGRDVYHAALRDPDSLAALPLQKDVRFESVNYVAMTTYEEMTGKDYGDALVKVWLSPELEKAIAGGITFAADIDGDYINGHFPHVFPKLTALYEHGRQSVRSQLRQAGQKVAEAKNEQQTAPKQSKNREGLE